MVRNRGSEIIDIKGSSTSLSASKAIIDHIKNFENNTPCNNWFCVAVPSDGSYGVDKNLIFSFPLTNKGQIEYKIVNYIGLSNRTINNIKESINAIKKEIEIAYSVINKRIYTMVHMPDSETAVESDK
jgi:malate dehydrogenase